MARMRRYPRAARREEASPRSGVLWLTRIRERGLSYYPLIIPTLLTLAGLGLAAVMLTLDAGVGESAVPGPLSQLGETNVRNVLVALLGAQLTIVVLVFWVRIVAVSMASRMFSASLLQSFLHDRFQQVTMGLVIGVLAYSLVVSQAVPDTGAGMTTMPHYSVALALALALVVAVLVVGSVSEGARTSRTGSMLRRVGDDVLAQVRATHPERGQVHGAARADLASPEPPDRPSHVVRANHSGWVQRLEEDRLLSALPPGAVAELDVRVGHFLTEGTPLCRVWTASGDTERAPEPGQELDAAVDRNLRTAVVLGDGPTLEQDVAFGLRMLSDVAERALAPASGDTSAAEQAIVRLGVVLRELLVRDLPAPTRQDQHERMLLRPCELGIDDYVHKAFDRIRQAGVDSPAVAAALLNTLGMLREALEEVDRHAWVTPLQRQALLIVEGARCSGMLVADYHDVRDLAERQELVSPQEVRPDEPASPASDGQPTPDQAVRPPEPQPGG